VLQIRKGTGVCSENCQEILRIDPDFGRHRHFEDGPKK
jgi:predicted nucleic acid-binding Zn ribbon protein